MKLIQIKSCDRVYWFSWAWADDLGMCVGVCKAPAKGQFKADVVRVCRWKEFLTKAEAKKFFKEYPQSDVGYLCLSGNPPRNKPWVITMWEALAPDEAMIMGVNLLKASFFAEIKFPKEVEWFRKKGGFKK